MDSQISIRYDHVCVLIVGWQSNYEHIHAAILDSIKFYDPNLAFIVVDWTFANQLYLNENERIYEPLLIVSMLDII